MVGRKFTVFALRAISKYKPYIWRGDLTEGFFALRGWGEGGGGLHLEGLIRGRAYF